MLRHVSQTVYETTLKGPCVLRHGLQEVWKQLYHNQEVGCHMCHKYSIVMLNKNKHLSLQASDWVYIWTNESIQEIYYIILDYLNVQGYYRTIKQCQDKLRKLQM